MWKSSGNGRAMVAADIGCDIHPYGEYGFWLTIRKDMLQPTQKGEREEALAVFRDIIDTVKVWDSVGSVRVQQLAEDGIRALLSSSKAEGEMRERVRKLEAVLGTMVEEFEDATYDMNDGSQSPYRRGLCADARATLSPKESGK